MAYTMKDFIRAIQGLLQEPEDGEYDLGPEDLRDNIESAVRHHSTFSPQVKVKDIAGTGAYDLTLPTDWVMGFSGIESIEYPLGSQVPEYIESQDLMLYRTSSTTTVIRFLATAPAVGSTARLVYTLPHYVTETACSLPDSDFWAVANLAASYAALVLAAMYTRTWSASLDADVLNYMAKARDWRDIAQKCEAIWRLHTGVSDKGSGNAPASGQGDWDLKNSLGQDFLVHKSYLR